MIVHLAHLYEVIIQPVQKQMAITDLGRFTWEVGSGLGFSDPGPTKLWSESGAVGPIWAG